MTHSIFFAFISFILGACLGSFYNVCIYRYIAGESIVTPRSHCPKCSHVLSWWENIPIISYLILRGRCLKCGEKISIKYLVVELIAAIWALGIYLKFGFSIQFFIFLLFGGIFIILSFIDLEIFILPDELTLPGSILAFLSAPLIGVSFKLSFWGAVVGGGFFLLIQQGYKLIKGREGLGTGDIKLMFMIGALLGVSAIPFVVFVGSIMGLLGGLYYLKKQNQTTQNPIPFGPFLCLAACLYMLIGKEVILWYLGLLSK